MRLVLPFLLASLATAAFAEETGADRRMPMTAEEVDTVFGEFWNAGDAEGIVGLYEADAVLVGLDGTMVQGTAAIREAVGSFGLGASKIDMKVVKIARAGEDLAVLFNQWTIHATNEDGTPLEISGKAMEVVRRQADGTWRYAFDHPVAGDGVGWTEAPAAPAP